MLCRRAVGVPKPPCVCIRTHRNDHVRTLTTLSSMSEFVGLRKHEHTQHALVDLGSAALAAAVALPKERRPEFQAGD